MRHVGSRRPCIMYEGKWWIAALVLPSFFIEGDLTPAGAWLCCRCDLRPLVVYCCHLTLDLLLPPPHPPYGPSSYNILGTVNIASFVFYLWFSWFSLTSLMAVWSSVIMYAQAAPQSSVKSVLELDGEKVLGSH